MRILLSVLLAATVFGQVPAQFTNLQIFPKDISRQELMSAMRGYSFSLGVRCATCHVGRPDGSLEGMDFASDAKETKKTARVMLKMVQAMNHDYMEKLGAGKRVECQTCHHGLSKP